MDEELCLENPLLDTTLSNTPVSKIHLKEIENIIKTVLVEDDIDVYYKYKFYRPHGP